MTDINVKQLVAEYESSTDDLDRSYLACCLLSNPDCPVEIIEEWMFHFPQQTIENIALDLWLLADPGLIERAAQQHRGSMIDLRYLPDNHPITKKAEELNYSIMFYSFDNF